MCLAHENNNGICQPDKPSFKFQGLRFHVRQIGERKRNDAHCNILPITLDTPCPTYFTLAQTDAVLEGIGRSIDFVAQASPSPDWHLPGYHMDTGSPAWPRDWLLREKNWKHRRRWCARCTM